MFLWVSNKFFTFVPSSLVWCSIKNPLPLYMASFLMIFSNVWIISRLLLLLSNVVSPHLFNRSSQLIFVTAQSKVPLLYSSLALRPHCLTEVGLGVLLSRLP